MRLSSGAQIAAALPESFQPSGKVTVVVRPENTRLVREAGAINGVLENIVYFGTDTHFHVRSDDGQALIVRQQNMRGMQSGFAAGERVGVAIGDDAAQVLKD